MTPLTLSSPTKATLFLIILWRCSAGCEHGITLGRDRTICGSICRTRRWRRRCTIRRQCGALSTSTSVASRCPLSAGNPVATTYWRWRLIGDPFAIYQPASSAVGMYQMTDAAFAEAEGYCIVHHAVVETGCSATALHSRVVPRHATELTAVFLDRNVAAILGYRRKTKISRQQREELAAVIHLCGTGPATAFAPAGRRSPKDRTIPRPKPEKPLGGARPRAPLL